ncbi:hypothetical protein [uncultured Duncaniella sp.]|uniref:hypothetical protein n=1 Tax=uncultured Duncaniella sp. TaxID=2768039 RepID=UPI0026396355|nr:hypothetical protein [uncultured Duncaniella sp.]
MAEYILQILRSQLMIMWSWGFNSPTRLSDDRGLAFKVQGFKYKGWVEVIYEEGTDTFTVILKKTAKKVEDVYFDELVHVIDSLVERTEDYEERVYKEYGFTA